MDDKGKKEFGNFLKSLRESRSLKPKELADKAGIQPDRYRKYEEGVNRPKDIWIITRISDALGLKKYSEEREKLFWLAREWVERAVTLEGLPASRCRFFLGRTELIDEVKGVLQDSRGAHIVLLSAYGGYGKSELARYLAAKLVEEKIFVDAPWVPLKQKEFEFIRGSIPQKLNPIEPSQQEVLLRLMRRFMCKSEEELKSVLRETAFLNVIDNVEALPTPDREELLSTILNLLGDGPSRAIMTSRFDLVAPYIYKPTFPGLSFKSTRELILREAAYRFPKTSELANASIRQIEEIWLLTRGMPLALHLVIGQCEQFELKRVLENLKEARASGLDEAFYTFILKQAWQDLEIEAKGLLVYLGTTTQAPQTRKQLNGLRLLDGLILDNRSLDKALSELSRWNLVERIVTEQEDNHFAYDLHPITRYFIRNPEIRGKWETEFDEHQLHEQAFRKHRDILVSALNKVEHTEDFGKPIKHAIPDFLLNMQYYLTFGDPRRVIWYWREISNFLWMNGRYAEHIECERYAFTAAEKIGEGNPIDGQRLQANILTELAFVYMDIWQLDRAEGYANQAEAILRKLIDRTELSRVLRFQANIAYRGQNFQKALQLCQEGLKVLDEMEAQQVINETKMIESTTHMDIKSELLSYRIPLYSLLGATYRKLNDFPSAFDVLIRALSLARQLQRDTKIYFSLAPLLNLAKVCISCSLPKKARLCYERCLAWTKDGTRPDMRAGSLFGLAKLSAQEGQWEQALEQAQQADYIYGATGRYEDQDKVISFIQELSGRLRNWDYYENK